MPLNLIYTNADTFINTILSFSDIYGVFSMSYSSFDLSHTGLSLGGNSSEIGLNCIIGEI